MLTRPKLTAKRITWMNSDGLSYQTVLQDPIEGAARVKDDATVGGWQKSPRTEHHEKVTHTTPLDIIRTAWWKVLKRNRYRC